MEGRRETIERRVKHESNHGFALGKEKRFNTSPCNGLLIFKFHRIVPDQSLRDGANLSHKEARSTVVNCLVEFSIVTPMK